MIDSILDIDKKSFVESNLMPEEVRTIPFVKRKVREDADSKK